MDSKVDSNEPNKRIEKCIKNRGECEMTVVVELVWWKCTLC